MLGINTHLGSKLSIVEAINLFKDKELFFVLLQNNKFKTYNDSDVLYIDKDSLMEAIIERELRDV